MLIPGTNFNKNRDKLFFFTGYEYFYQVLDTGLLRATVPTAAMSERRLLAGGNRQGRQHHGVRRPSRPLNARRGLYPGGIIPQSRSTRTCRR